MTIQKGHWTRTPDLHKIGAPVRSIQPKPTKQCAPLPGSRPVAIVNGNLHKHKGKPVKWDKPYYEPKITICRGHPGYDARYSVAPGETVFGAGFAAAGPGINIETGKGWE